MQRIESRENRYFRLGVDTRSGKGPGLVFAEGRRLAADIIETGRRIEVAFFSDSFYGDPGNRELTGLAIDLAASARVMPDKLFSSLADTKHPQGIVLICERPSLGLRDIAIRTSAGPASIPLAILLHRVSQPGNLGAVIRTAAASGAAGVVTTCESSDAFSPASIRGSAGAVFRTRIVEKVNFETAVNWAGKEGLTTSFAGSGGEIDYRRVDWKRKRLLVFGSEAHGLKPEEAGSLKESIRIPMERGVESLNLAVSAGILLYQAHAVCGSG